MDQLLQDNKNDTTFQTIPMGGCTSHRMKDLTQRTLLRLCGEEQGDYHIAWRRLSIGWGLVSSLDMEAKGIYEKIRKQLKWILDVLRALQKNKNLTSKKEVEVQNCLRRTVSAYNAIFQLFDGAYDVVGFRLEAITGGSDSLCEVTIMISNTARDGRISVGKSVGLDIVDTSADAIMEAINRDYSSE